MKKIALVVTCFMLVNITYAQIIKIDNGITINNLKGAKFDLFPNKVVSYSGMLGIEYLQRKWFYLSSEVGYLKLGGKESRTIGTMDTPEKQTWSYLQLNTTFRLKTGAGNTEFFVGAGPYLNVLVGSGDFIRDMYAGYATQRTNWGGKVEVGVNQRINKLRVGVNGAYLIPFSAVAKSSYTSMDARCLAVYLSLGYRLR